ncbi:zinc-binding dehydrogenase [Alteribacter natronophilus]|uniref:zinc-binding dehydrogenase n=1 Tax=Alteribacter natronophilus TaxID=2583810 RepID=UPI00110F045F|nr:zinc-binding dehydrogenase [Alteribacter natronophilus]TMW71491.1 zinc-binding dehydrogenase [Alteribacter natronophilus]
MKAVVLRETGGPDKLNFEEVSKPEPGEGEVLVKLEKAALNRRDVFITYGMYPGMSLPAVPGADGAGVVEECGEGVSGWSSGDEVIINPGLNWGDDPEFNGPDFHILGMPTDGTYAEYVKVPAEQVYRKPEHLSWEEAAALPLAALTAYRAVVTRGKVQEGETVFIPGIGSGVATFALQFALARGARVFVSSGSDEKLERAEELGASGGVNYKSEGYVKKLKKEMGAADLCVDGVGGKSFNDLISVAKPAGRIVNFGATTGPVPELLLPKLFFKHLDLRGTTMGSPEDFKSMLAFVGEHKIQPEIDRTFALDEAAEAQKYMEAGRQLGKIVLDI